MREPNIVRTGWLTTLTLLGLTLAGCSLTSTPVGTDLLSRQSSLKLTLRPTTTVYAARDRNTADFYMTDLPPGSWNKPTAELAGSLVHVHVFLTPKPGSTPIADDSCSFTVRQVVFSGGGVGVYSGGGFVYLTGDIGEPECGGEFRGATLRLTSSNADFVDRLGPAEMNGRVEAKRNDAAAGGWATLLARVVNETKERR